MSELSADRKAANWNAICNGRDLLSEIGEREERFRIDMEQKFREEILNGNKDYIKPPPTAGDTLDWS